MYERAGLVGTLVWTILQVQNAPLCKELRVECVYLQGCLHYTGVFFLSSGSFKKKVRSVKITRINTKHKGFLNMGRGMCEGAGVGEWGGEGLFLLEAQDKFLFYL